MKPNQNTVAYHCYQISANGQVAGAVRIRDTAAGHRRRACGTPQKPGAGGAFSHPWWPPRALFVWLGGPRSFLLICTRRLAQLSMSRENAVAVGDTADLDLRLSSNFVYLLSVAGYFVYSPRDVYRCLTFPLKLNRGKDLAHQQGISTLNFEPRVFCLKSTCR
jgi:hypothetical protein